MHEKDIVTNFNAIRSSGMALGQVLQTLEHRVGVLSPHVIETSAKMGEHLKHLTNFKDTHNMQAFKHEMMVVRTQVDALCDTLRTEQGTLEQHKQLIHRNAELEMLVQTERDKYNNLLQANEAHAHVSAIRSKMHDKLSMTMDSSVEHAKRTLQLLQESRQQQQQHQHTSVHDSTVVRNLTENLYQASAEAARLREDKASLINERSRLLKIESKHKQSKSMLQKCHVQMLAVKAELEKVSRRAHNAERELVSVRALNTEWRVRFESKCTSIFQKHKCDC